MLKIRLARGGRKNHPIYRIVVADSRSPRDGRFVEKIGTYNPQLTPSTIKVDEELAIKRLMDGAQPSDTVRRLFSKLGIMYRKHLQMGVKRGKIKQEYADAQFNAWQKKHGSKKGLKKL